MRTITINKEINLFTFSELSDDAKDYAHTNWLNKGYYWPLGGEAEDTIRKVENLFHISLNNWSIGSYRPEYPDIEWDDWWCNCWGDSSTELKGNRARAFLWNNFGHVLLKGRYYSGRYGKEYEHSRIFLNRVYDGTCPLTGVCFDCDALDPLANFCFGVEWSEKEKKRVMTKDRLIAHDNRTTVGDVISYCVYSMFTAFNTDVEDSASIEHFADECEANDWEFTEDGEMY